MPEASQNDVFYWAYLVNRRPHANVNPRTHRARTLCHPHPLAILLCQVDARKAQDQG